MRRIILTLFGVGTCGLAAVYAQNGIDPALLAKASAGDTAAEVQVGESYETGKGVDRDYSQAAAWYLKAADQGTVAGELHLAELYRDGGGKAFPRDPVKSAQWYLKAADQGDVSAQGTMGMLYMLGVGVPRSDADAYFWLDLASSAQGPDQERYEINRQNVGTRITADQLDEIGQRVAAWKAKHPHRE
ncbi:MAG TPA: tetratricopeptide repeat protein [Terracidiphilus sp.]|nr:tetratricopeptide repeat protein [Terracidiphilus sp.]